MIFQCMLIDYTTKITSLLLLQSLSCRLSCHHIFVSSYMTVIIFSIVMSVMPSWEPADALFNCTGTIPILNYCPCSHHHHHHHHKNIFVIINLIIKILTIIINLVYYPPLLITTVVMLSKKMSSWPKELNCFSSGWYSRCLSFLGLGENNLLIWFKTCL